MTNAGDDVGPEPPWSAPAERSGDGAFDRAERLRVFQKFRARESGVALRLRSTSENEALF